MWGGLTLAWMRGRKDKVAFGTLPLGLNREHKAIGNKFGFLI